MKEYDIWNEVLGNLGYEFVEEYTIGSSKFFQFIKKMVSV
jgi:hypothetical protein